MSLSSGQRAETERLTLKSEPGNSWDFEEEARKYVHTAGEVVSPSFFLFDKPNGGNGGAAGRGRRQAHHIRRCLHDTHNHHVFVLFPKLSPE